jgi:hypothetical protein
MASTPYATVADLESYLGVTPPDNAAYLLRDAQDLLDATALLTASYAADTNGNPTDAKIIAALKKAACQQVEWWLQTGDPLDEMGQYQSFAIEGLSVSRKVDASPDRVCKKARDTLRVAGLSPGQISI